MRDPLLCGISDPEALSQQALMEEAQRQAFEATCTFVQGNILHQNTVVKLDFLKDIYSLQIVNINPRN